MDWDGVDWMRKRWGWDGYYYNFNLTSIYNSSHAYHPSVSHSYPSISFLGCDVVRGMGSSLSSGTVSGGGSDGGRWDGWGRSMRWII